MHRSFIVVAALTLVAPAVAFSDQIVLTTTSVIGGSGDYNNGTYKSPNGFSTLNVVSQQTGNVSEKGQDGSYWLTQNSTPPPTRYFVLDLGAPVLIGEIDLFNTHNGGYDDRGTGNYAIFASNSITAADATLGSDLLTPVQIAGGTMQPGNTAVDPIPAQPAQNLDVKGVAYQYLRFEDQSIGAAADTGFGAAGGGLNEIRVFSTPEPGSLALVAMGAFGLLARRRAQ